MTRFRIIGLAGALLLTMRTGPGIPADAASQSLTFDAAAGASTVERLIEDAKRDE